MSRNVRNILVLHTNKLTKEHRSAAVEIITVEVSNDGKEFRIINEPNGYIVRISFGSEIGSVYSRIVKGRKKLNITDNLYESAPIRKLNLMPEYREITLQEEVELQRESSYFSNLEYQESIRFIQGVAKDLETQLHLVEVEFYRRVRESYSNMDYTMLTFVTDSNSGSGRQVLSELWQDVFNDVQNFLEPMISDDKYWAIRFSSISWDTNILTVKFKPFNVLLDAEKHRGVYTAESSKKYLESFYKRTNGDPRGPRIGYYMPTFRIRSVCQGGERRWMHWAWENYSGEDGWKGYN